MADRTLHITLVNGTPRTGIWCRHCQLPSAIEVDIYWLRSDGPYRLGSGRSCTDCGSRQASKQTPAGETDA